MTELVDVRRIRQQADHASIMLGWVMIVLIVAGGLSALAYAIGKFQGMNLCR